MNNSEELQKLKYFINNESPYGVLEFRDQRLIVLPTVFPPIFNTNLLSVVVEELVSKFIEKQNLCRVFEMGPGCGAAILTVAKIKGVIASASDIAPMAVLNTKANALWWGVECDAYQGNLFENVPEEQFDIIFWNIPFVKENPGDIEDVKFRSAFDPNYQYLTKFLEQVNNRLTEHGQIVLAVDYILCDLDTVYILIDKAGFSSEVYKEGKIIWQQEEITYAYLLLTRKFG
ncbi:release factor glutamine methyltransferase [Tolypothrix sp. NIES-4075]|uniref:methyltransferase n=1 Tax=Tolypothrix sp. NIES-4075 TaxID=2005459 RepID=UPI000B5CFDBA|nr:methyltransferase [Tolypothrix sp. NIES-4075]GAX43179.1 release factor glutamine methyltransferase [Tolypothrix sp. NIES-4075]